MLTAISAVVDASGLRAIANPGQIYAALWAAYRTQTLAFDDTVSALGAQEGAQFGIAAEHLRCFTPDRYASERALGEVALSIYRQLIRIARERFSPPGARLEIGENAAGFGIDGDGCAAFDPAAVWAHLEDAYGGAAGADAAYQQAARLLWNEFNLKDPDATARKAGGATLLNLRVWCDSFTKKWNGRYELSYGCHERVTKVVLALAAVAAWAQRPALQRDLGGGHDSFAARGARITSRARYDLGEKGELIIVTYSERFEFRFAAPLAEQLHIFISSYVPPSLLLEAA